MKLNWGAGIVWSLILFAAFVFTLVARMIFSGNDLLSARTYRSAEEINLDIQSLKESREFHRKFNIQTNLRNGNMELTFQQKPDSGTIQLTCLGNAGADQTFRLQVTEETPGTWRQFLPLRNPQSGTWLLEIRGWASQKSILIREQIRLP